MSNDRSSVLVVDDDDDYRLLVSLSLEDHPCLEVAGEATTLDEGVADASRLRPSLVMVDTGIATEPRSAFGRFRQAAPEALLVAVSPGRLEPSPFIRASASASGVGLDGTGTEASCAGGGGERPIWHWLSKSIAPSSIGDRLVELLEAFYQDPDHVRTSRALPCELTSAAVSRRFVEQVLTDRSAVEMIDTATLLTSELVTNAIVYARTGCDLVVDLDRDRLQISVTDHDRSVVRRRRSELGDASGRGIELVEILATSWGIDRQEEGKRIWFELSGPDEGLLGGNGTGERSRGGCDLGGGACGPSGPR